jgi:FHA domain
MAVAGRSRRRIARTLNAAYASGLLSDETFSRRVDQLLRASLIEPAELVGDLNLRRAASAWPERVAYAMRRALTVAYNGGPAARQLLALDWAGTAHAELLIGRGDGCDPVLEDPAVSRRHARLSFRDGRWILQDLDSRNGTRVNGVRVGRCEVRPGDLVEVGNTQLTVD